MPRPLILFIHITAAIVSVNAKRKMPMPDKNLMRYVGSAAPV